MKKIVFILLLMSSLFCQAQDEEEENWQFPKTKKSTKDAKPIAHKLSIGTGLASYNGDLNPSITSISPGVYFSVGFRYYIRNKLTVKPQFALVQLKGDDAKTGDEIRNLAFHSTNFEWSINIVYDFFKFEPRWDLRKKVSPYSFINVGGLFFNPKATYNGATYDLQSLETEGEAYSKFTWIAAIGLGTRLAITPRSNINLEARYTYSFSDYLDDVSGSYRDNKDLTSIGGALADRTSEGGFTPTNTADGTHWTEGSPRGSRALNDGYLLFQIELEVDIFSHTIVRPIF